MTIELKDMSNEDLLDAVVNAYMKTGEPYSNGVDAPWEHYMAIRAEVLLRMDWYNVDFNV